MKKLHLALLWHMHQPYYKNDATYTMPWVFLHAIKDYYDMPRYCELWGAKATFNLVPSLMAQLNDYADYGVNDSLLKAMRKNPEQLEPEEVVELVPKLFMGQVEHMITPYPNYRGLYNFYIKTKNALQFSVQEIRDLCVHYLLAWTGMQTRRELPLAEQLLKKGGNFTEFEKQQLLDALQDSVGRILAYYKKLQDQGQIEISVTPFYHPILPLLIDLQAAKEALPEVVMPKIPANFAGFTEDATWHVSAAIEYYTREFGRKPSGMWPAEGSVSTAALELMAKHGIAWAASDEDVLGGSLVKDLRQPANRGLLYRKYLMETPHGELNLFFRDKRLSDLLGFSYASAPPAQAVGDFISKLRVIYDKADGDAIVPVILDGENAWEYYAEGGYTFFKTLYGELAALDWLSMRTMGELTQDAGAPAGRVNGVRAGSWIYGNFSTWIGHAEKNRGWELLTQTAADTGAVLDTLDAPRQEALHENLHIAQGSDWFWWYGDDHFTIQAAEYDNLFRSRLIKACETAGLEAPQTLATPIKTSSRTGLVRLPANFIAPVLDGKVTSFFEWMGAGLFDLAYDMSAMHHDERILRLFYWGFGRNYLYLRLDGDFKPLLNAGYTLEIDLSLEQAHTITVTLDKKPAIGGDLKAVVTAAIDDLAELQIPKNSLNLDDFKTMQLAFRIMKDGNLVERVPAYNTVEIETGLSSTFNWMT